MIAAMIDGVWLRAALSGWREADSESARALLTAFVDGRLEAAAAAPTPSGDGRAPAAGAQFRAARGRASASLPSIPATGRGAGLRHRRRRRAGQRGGARRAERRRRSWGAMTGAERGAGTAPRRRALALAQSGTRRARNARHRQAHPGDPRGRCRLGRGLLRILRRPRAES